MVLRKVLVPFYWLPLLSLVLVVSLAGYSHSQVTMEKAPSKADAAKVAVESLSLQVGEAFPNVELKNQDGEQIGLKKSLAKGAVVLVIYRSADW